MPEKLHLFAHAEEVQLQSGSVLASISSTTGRRNRVLAGNSFAKENRPLDESEVTLQSCDTVGHTGLHSSGCTAGGSGDGSGRAVENFAATKLPVVSAVPRPPSNAQLYPCFDIFGFRVTVEEKAAEDYIRRHHSYTKKYLNQWSDIIRHWDSTKHSKLKKYCRFGIPQNYRNEVWQRLMQSWNLKQKRVGVYATLLAEPLEPTTASIIERDLDRTFPTHRLFEDGGSKEGQETLRKLLHAYANFNKHVGYCQGMGFLAATLMLQVEDEEDAFWAFVSIMENPKYDLKQLYGPGFPQLHCVFYVFDCLINKKLHHLSQKMHLNQIVPSFYATHWFLTLFSYYFTFGLVSRIWDMFLCEGWKPIYRVALALLKMEQQMLLSASSEGDLLMALKNVQEAKKPMELLQKSLSIKFKTALVLHYTKNYRKGVGNLR